MEYLDGLLEFGRLTKSEQENIKSQCKSRGSSFQEVLNEASKRNKLLLRNIKSLLHLFCISYHSTVKRKRKFILYHAANLLIEKVNFNIPLFSKKDMIEIITKNVNVIYKQIKQNEMQPNTSYLFNNSFTTNNFDKSIEKINKMDKLNYIPRN